MQRLVSELNYRFAPERIGELVAQREAFRPEGDWVERLGDLGAPAEFTLYLAKFPTGLREMMRALVYEDLGRGAGVLPVTWAWAPAYDYELQAWECPGNLGSLGGITILVRSRYPSDPHPSAPVGD
jgi:hypothetical protein